MAKRYSLVEVISSLCSSQRLELSWMSQK